ncbi:hypothetical protein J2Q15_13670 [Tenacibaculum finnmarkense genomovar finnmarkense]|uniref:hypothetical protein n=1 Tax=Tenacibaculum finnmarkense TaxID=2781243 RepID=UPI001EFBF66B|nr:hypothetical protein [Tenacibaculum finnmarkense]MCG8250571.1 hypothetical protein [Tenacibaculum finnmarkense genomovar finnmarkense]MCG8855179.1 hypothetical protein [Tenacibaculum finnmarkense]
MLLEQLQKSKHSLVNTRITTGTAPVNQNIHWQTLALLLEQLQKSKHSLAKYQGIFTDKFKKLVNTHFYSSSKSKYSLINTRIATGTAPKIKTFIGKYSLLQLQ